MGLEFATRHRVGARRRDSVDGGVVCVLCVGIGCGGGGGGRVVLIDYCHGVAGSRIEDYGTPSEEALVPEGVGRLRFSVYAD